MITFQGFLLSYIKYGDSDAVLHIFTYEYGFQSFFMKGIFSARSKKKSLLAPLNELLLTCKQTAKNNRIQNVSSMEMLTRRDLHQEVKIHSVLFFTAEFLHSVLKNENESVLVYKEISLFLNELENSNFYAHNTFLIRLLSLLGHAPLLSSKLFLNPESGHFENLQVHPQFDEEVSLFWKQMLSKEPNISKSFKNLKKEILDSIVVYYQIHFEGFKKPKSLEIVREIFEN